MTPSSASSSAPGQAATKPARPDWLPEAHWDVDNGIKAEFGQHYRDLVAFQAAEASRLLTLPQKPEDYKLALSKDFKAPQGIEFIPNDKDPLLPQAQAFALKHRLSQDAFSELLDLHAAGQIGTQQAIAQAKEAEVAKLGASGTARKTAVDTWLNATLGEELGQHMAQFTFTAKQVEGLEKLMTIVRTQGQGSFSHTGREPPDQAGRVSEEQFAKMGNAERIDYARRFPQAQFWNGGGGR